MSGTKNTTDGRPTPVEVWVRVRDVGGCEAMVVHEDESTRSWELDALSLRGAEREVTGWLIADGYEPVGRWQDEAEDRDGPVEAYRTFRVKKEV